MNQDDDFGDLSLHELFRTEAESQAQLLTDGLLALDRGDPDPAVLDSLMRAAHSLKGAARIVNLEPVEQLAHVMEDCFVAAQNERLRLSKDRIDRLLAGVDLIVRIAALSETAAPAWLEQNKLQIADLLAVLYASADPATAVEEAAPVPAPAPAAALAAIAEPAPAEAARDEQVLKVNVRSFDRLLALASESRVGVHALQPGLRSLQRHKQRQHEMFQAFEQLQQALAETQPDDMLKEKLAQLRHRIDPLRQDLVQRIAEFEAYERRLLSVSEEMLDEVLTLRMRPFRDGVQGFPRMVRDLGRSLGKDVRLEIVGNDTPVDREVLARMESPLNQLLRNALDHGIEQPQQRLAAGKPAQGTLRLEARHSAGMLLVRVGDDGRGVDLERVRTKVIERGMASASMAASLSGAELLDFLLLPAFSLKDSAGTVSGRGVGLDVVQAAIRALGGSLRLETRAGAGFDAHITLPLSQSIKRALVVRIAGEPYALPVAKIERVLRVAADDIHTLEDKQFFVLGGEHVGLISAAQLLALGETPSAPALPVIVIGNPQRRYALAVDAIIGEQSLAVQPLDAMFGKLRDISSAALLDDGSPVLILDVADLLVGIERLAGSGGLRRLQRAAGVTRHKRILVVDDSLTVREMERKLLAARGFEVDTAVDGIDGWNAVRTHQYDLVITDVDMPRMDGIELVTLIKNDNRLHTLPAMIVSYKDRPQDRARGVEAGADYYLTKGSFHDETLLEAVFDLIGDSDG
jgi:two-component system sensor histidine kinase and response regulator WspE